MFLGITQERIDECRAAKENAMLSDIQAQLPDKVDLNAQDNNGATLVRKLLQIWTIWTLWYNLGSRVIKGAYQWPKDFQQTILNAFSFIYFFL